MICNCSLSGTDACKNCKNNGGEIMDAAYYCTKSEIKRTKKYVVGDEIKIEDYGDSEKMSLKHDDDYCLWIEGSSMLDAVIEVLSEISREWRKE